MPENNYLAKTGEQFNLENFKIFQFKNRKSYFSLTVSSLSLI